MEQTQQDQVQENSPLAVAESVIRDFMAEKFDSAAYLEALTRYTEHVQGWRVKLQKLVPPEEDEQSQLLLTGANQGIDMIDEGVKVLRGLATDKSLEIAEKGLQLIAEGQELLHKVKDITDNNVSEAIEESRYID